MDLVDSSSSTNFPDVGVVNEDSRTLWVGGIHAEVNEELLFELFLNCGPVENVRIPKDQQTMKQKRYGFVIFKHKASVLYAINQMSGIKLFGQKIHPKISTSRKQSLGGLLHEVNDNVIKPQVLIKLNNNTNCAHPEEKLLPLNNIVLINPRFLGSRTTLSSLRRRILEEKRDRSKDLRNRIQSKPERSQRHIKIDQNGINDELDSYEQDKRSVDRRRDTGRDGKYSQDRSRSKIRESERREKQISRRETSERDQRKSNYDLSEPVAVDKKILSKTQDKDRSGVIGKVNVIKCMDLEEGEIVD